MDGKIAADVDEAMAGIEDGSTVLIGGFGPGTPWNLIAALYRQGAKGLTIVCNGASGGSLSRMMPNAITHETLIAERRVRKVIASFTAATHPSQVIALEKLVAAGEAEAELTPQGTLAERIRAGGAGIPAFFTPTGVGTEMAVGKEHRQFGGRTYVMEHAITADYALVRAWKADRFGNLVFRRAQRNYNPIMAMAARCTIVEVEEPVVDEGALDPDHIHTSGIYVHRITQIPVDGILHLTKAPMRPVAVHA